MRRIGRNIVTVMLSIAILGRPIVLHAQQIITQDMLLKSSAAFIPDILLAELDIEKARNKRLQAEGQFDASVEQTIGAYLDGFYDGKQIDTRVVKPLPFMNSTVYGGYRVSDGIYPVYEDELVTNNDGELLFGAKVALLRDRDIDKNRAALTEADILIEQAEAKKLATQLRVQQDALNAYWHWVMTGLRVEVYADMLKLAQTRQNQLKQRVVRGDLADIYLTENQQYILRRQSQKERALQQHIFAAQHLSFYWRDSDGVPLLPSQDQLPNSIPLVSGNHTSLETEKARLLQRPEMQMLLQEVSLQQLKQDLGENALLPELDLDVKVSDDWGAGSPRRDETEMKMMLNISIPLQQRYAKGKIAEARTSLKQLELQRRRELEQFTIKLNAIHTELVTARELVRFAERETELAEKIQKAEEIRFQNGDSDFFTLNAREESLAKTNIGYLNAKENFYKAQTALYAILADTEKLYIE